MVPKNKIISCTSIYRDRGSPGTESKSHWNGQLFMFTLRERNFLKL